MGFEAEAGGPSRPSVRTVLGQEGPCWCSLLGGAEQSWRAGGMFFRLYVLCTPLTPPQRKSVSGNFVNIVEEQGGQRKKGPEILAGDVQTQKISGRKSLLPVPVWYQTSSARPGWHWRAAKPPLKGGHLPCQSPISSWHNPVSGSVSLGFLLLSLPVPRSPCAPASQLPAPGLGGCRRNVTPR